MGVSNAFSAVPELFVEERLFSALVTGPLEQSEGLFDSLEEVDIRLTRQKTLLHVGVGLGKVDWVEELLARGADPNLEDSGHLTAMSTAEEMLRRFPEDSDRRQVMRLVRMVHRRDRAMRRRPEACSARSAVCSTPMFQPEHMSVMATLSSSVEALKEKMRSLRAELLSSLKELKVQVCGQDALLRCLEGAVTLSAEQLTLLSGQLQREAALGAMWTTSGIPLPLYNMAIERRECVDGMMRRTEVMYGGEEGVRRMRRIYERLYDEDDSTACLLKFLHRESRFVAKVDCGAFKIARMRETIVDLYGRERRVRDWTSLPELSSYTVYLGAKVFRGKGITAGCNSADYVVGVFAWSLAQMSLHLCFDNGGKPYEEHDGVHETEWKSAFKKAVEDTGELDGWLEWVLNWDTQTEKESVVAASVPLIIAEYGSTEGSYILQQQVPLLFRYFKEHVVATLIAKAKE